MEAKKIRGRRLPECHPSTTGRHVTRRPEASDRESSVHQTSPTDSSYLPILQMQTTRVLFLALFSSLVSRVMDEFLVLSYTVLSGSPPWLSPGLWHPSPRGVTCTLEEDEKSRKDFCFSFEI